VHSRKGAAFQKRRTPQLVNLAIAAGSSFKVHGNLAADYSVWNGGGAVLVMIDGSIVFERDDNGFGGENTIHLPQRCQRTLVIGDRGEASDIVPPMPAAERASSALRPSTRRKCATAPGEAHLQSS
jgi:hypothetical protein